MSMKIFLYKIIVNKRYNVPRIQRTCGKVYTMFRHFARFSLAAVVILPH